MSETICDDGPVATRTRQALANEEFFEAVGSALATFFFGPPPAEQHFVFGPPAENRDGRAWTFGDHACCLCDGTIGLGHGNNAAPVADGLCCDRCNFRVVIPARLNASAPPEMPPCQSCGGPGGENCLHPVIDMEAVAAWERKHDEGKDDEDWL